MGRGLDLHVWASSPLSWCKGKSTAEPKSSLGITTFDTMTHTRGGATADRANLWGDEAARAGLSDDPVELEEALAREASDARLCVSKLREWISAP